MGAQAKKELTNAELNKLLCESREPVPIREGKPPAQEIRLLTVAEAIAMGGAVAESGKANGPALYEAKVMQADKKNQNNRIYPRKLLQANIDRLKPSLSGGQLIGTSGHPGDEEYSGDPSRITKKWVDLRMGDDGAVTGVFSVVPTDLGKDLQVVLAEKLSALGFSSYGYGTGHEPSEDEQKKYGLGDDEECVIMDDNYELCQIDSVRGPSVRDAAVTKYPENAEQRQCAAEACSSCLHWRQIGRCGHQISECKCDSDESKHCVYTESVCQKCADRAGEGLSAAQFQTAIKESSSKRPKVSEGHEPLAKTYTQYLQGRNSFEPAGPIKLAPALSTDAFNIVPTWSGIRFDRHVIQNDQAYRFAGSPAEMVLSEIEAFWKKKDEYKKYGVMHRRGIVVHGPAGTGKTIGIDQAVEAVTSAGDVAFYGENIGALIEGLKAFREVEPDRKVLVVLEDAEKYIGHQERAMLQLLDGADSIEGVLYIASTNYLERFPERLLRSRRFDRKVFVGPPNLAGRKAYLQNKLGKSVAPEEVDRIAKETDGLSYGDLATLITDAFILEEKVDSVIARLKNKAVAQDHRLHSSDGQKPVAERRVNQTPRETEMDPIKSLIELKEKAPAVHAEHVAAVQAAVQPVEAAHKKICDAINPILKALKEIGGVEFPQREVLPAEIAERQRSNETKISALEAEKVAWATEKAELQGKLDAVQKTVDAKERAAKILVKALPILKDNAYAVPLRAALREKAAADPTFDDAKVEAFIAAKCEEYDLISGGKNKGKIAEGEGPKPGKGKNLSDDDVDALEGVSETGEDEDDEASPELASAFGRRKVAERRPTAAPKPQDDEEL